ncbi:hypothetical protein [Candidatus Methylopumilus planktonicus]|uniref:hypothetical protein n=1 Tax=Candidatus Methylopumilus planktonicus TaxID=1581557 RepID=UPI003BEEE758
MHKYKILDVLIYALLISAIALLVSFGSFGLDWYIVNSQADIINSSIRNFGDFHPFFSFNIGEGYYLSQDPQSPLFTLMPLFIWLAGPDIGIRLNIVFLLFIGSLGTYAFFSRHICHEASLFCMSAWGLSSGLFWRITVGNDMFVWHFLVPILLLCIGDIFKYKNFKSVIILSLVGVFFLLGPTFHTIFYFAAPLIFSYIIVEFLVMQKKGMGNIINISSLLLFSLLISFIGASIKIFQFYVFSGDYYRPTLIDGVSSYSDYFTSLFNYFESKHKIFSLKAPKIIPGYTVGDFRVPGYGNHEYIVALSPVSSILSLFFFPLLFFYKNFFLKYKTLVIFSIVTLFVGSFLSLNFDLWLKIREITNNSIRVSPRFIIVSSFALLVMAGLACELFIVRYRFSGIKKLSALNFIFALFWIIFAIKGGILTFGHSSISVDPLNNSEISCYKPNDRFLYSTGVYQNFYYVAGNELKDGCIKADKYLNSAIQISNNVINISRIEPGQVLTVPFTYPIKNFSSNDHDVIVRNDENKLQMINPTQKVVNNFALKVNYPSPLLVVTISIFVIFALLISALYYFNLEIASILFRLGLNYVHFRFLLLSLCRTILSYFVYLFLLKVVNPVSSYLITFIVFSLISYIAKGRYIFFSKIDTNGFFVYLTIPFFQMCVGAVLLQWLIGSWLVPPETGAILVSAFLLPATYVASKFILQDNMKD